MPSPGASAVEKKSSVPTIWHCDHAAELALAGGFSRLNIGQRIATPRAGEEALIAPAGVYGPGGIIYPQWIYNPGVAYFAHGIGPSWMYEDPFADQPQIAANGRITAKFQWLRPNYLAGLPRCPATAQRLAARCAGAAY